MAKVLIAYYSRTGNTKAMAKVIAGAIKAEGNSVDLKLVTNVKVPSLLNYDAIILGTPVYYGTMAAEVKKLIDASVKLHGQLENTIGGAFASSANIGGGNETAITDIIHAFLIHGMIVRGDPEGDHYGPVSINRPNQRVIKNCRRFGKRIALLLKKVK